MRILSFKVLFALVVLPPVLYVSGVQGLEQYLEDKYRLALEKQIPGDVQSLLTGRMRLTDQLETAVETQLASIAWRHRGVDLSVAVRTRAGRRLYPPVYNENGVEAVGADPMRIASENYTLLNEGLELTLSVTIDHNTYVANSILAMSILFSLSGLAIIYRRSQRAFAREKAVQRREQEAVEQRDKQQKAELTILSDLKDNLAEEIETIQQELQEAQERAARNEADLFNEVEDLENRLEQNVLEQDHQQSRIQQLEEQLAQLTAERKALDGHQVRTAGGLRKRMETLYKNTSFSDRSLSSLAQLPEAMQIKAEEAIHHLDAHTGDVPIKRKLFRGKGKETIFEMVFAYKGRLYFRRTKARKVDILAIGTKNSQEKDLVYLDRL